ncbi:hypothetical protein Emag_001584 [Eimeria magna]
MESRQESFSRRPSVGKEVGWDDVFRNVLSKDFGSSHQIGAGGLKSTPKLAPEHPGSAVTYVKLQPSKDLAILASESDEAIQAVKTLANALSHRSRFIGRYKNPESSAAVCPVDCEYSLSSSPSRCFPTGIPEDASGAASAGCSPGDVTQRPHEGNTSKEPHFDPLNVQPPPPCSAQCDFVDGVMQVYWKPGEDLANPPLLWPAGTIPTVREYLAALQDVMIAVQDPGIKRFRIAFKKCLFAAK